MMPAIRPLLVAMAGLALLKPTAAFARSHHDALVIDIDALVVVLVTLQPTAGDVQAKAFQSRERNHRPSAVHCKTEGNRDSDNHQGTERQNSAGRRQGTVSPGEQRKPSPSPDFAAVHARISSSSAMGSTRAPPAGSGPKARTGIPARCETILAPPTWSGCRWVTTAIRTWAPCSCTVRATRSRCRSSCGPGSTTITPRAPGSRRIQVLVPSNVIGPGLGHSTQPARSVPEPSILIAPRFARRNRTGLKDGQEDMLGNLSATEHSTPTGADTHGFALGLGRGKSLPSGATTRI